MPQTSSVAATLKPGQMISDCRILHEVKRGGMGCVYLAEQDNLNRRVAVKTILPFQDDDRARRMFLKEAKTCAKVDHPNVIAIYGAGEERGTPYIIMPFVDGRNLSEFLKEQCGPLPWTNVVRVIKLAVKGLAAVHAVGLVHRDIKPSNIMVSGGGRVYLMDFGLVRDASDQSQARSGAVQGTPNYMSPEQCRGEEADHRSDIFSIGSTLYHLLTNEFPFGKGQPIVIIGRIAGNQPVLPIHELNPSVPRAVSNVVQRAMAFEPRRRYQSAAELNKALRQLLMPQPQPFVSTPSALPEPDPSQSISGLKPQLAPLDLVPLDLTETQDTRPPSQVGKYILGGAALVAFLMLLLSLIPAGTEDPAAPVVVAPPEGMVEIPGGEVHLGLTQARLNAHFSKLRTEHGITPPTFYNDIDLDERTVYVPRFFIDKYEVTNQEYAAFVQATNRTPPKSWIGNQPDPSILRLPVTDVTYADALAYAESRGKQLPTADQWVAAFHGNERGLFPWGDDWDLNLTNTDQNQSFPGLSAVTATPDDVSRFGVFNLVGNAGEMTRDRFTNDEGEWFITKGARYSNAGWYNGLYAHFKESPIDFHQADIGFRCVQDIPTAAPTP